MGLLELPEKLYMIPQQHGCLNKSPNNNNINRQATVERGTHEGPPPDEELQELDEQLKTAEMGKFVVHRDEPFIVIQYQVIVPEILGTHATINGPSRLCVWCVAIIIKKKETMNLRGSEGGELREELEGRRGRGNGIIVF